MLGIRKKNKTPYVQAVLLFLFIFLFFSEGASAQADNDNKNGKEKSVTDNWQSWYLNYNENQFTVALPLTEENASRLKKRIQLFRYRILYFSIKSLENPATPTIQIGYFKDNQQAQDFISTSDFIFSGQHIQRVSKKEHSDVTQFVADQEKTNANQNYYVLPINADSSVFSIETSNAILDNAKKLYIEKNYRAAINHYLILSIIAEPKTAIWAKELTGLCYEKLGKTEQAIITYEDLINNYPEDASKTRVEQRLRGLLTAAEDGRDALKKSTYKNGNKDQFFVRGNIGQFQRNLTQSVNGGSDKEVMSLLSTNFDVRATGQWGNHSARARLNGFWLKDQLNNEKSETRIKRLFVDYQHQPSGTSVVIGRQKEFDSGMFASFDGFTAKYRVKKDLTVAASVGQPVYSSDLLDSFDYSFYSTYLNWSINKNWTINSYYTTQTLNGVTDRQAIGARGQYTDSKLYASLNIDYDTSFSEINNLLLNASYNITENMNLNGTYGQQRSPFLTTANILIGQPDLDLPLYLQTKENKDSLIDDAFARTSLNTYYSLSLNTKLGERSRLIVDMYQSDLTDIPSPEFLAGLPISQDFIDSYSQSSIGVQLIASDTFVKNDSASFGVRTNSGTSSSSTQLFFSDRVRIGNVFSFLPKLSLAQIDLDASNDRQNQFRYSLELIYRPFRNTEFNLEAGSESVSLKEADVDYSSQYIFIGYRVNF